MGKQLYLTNLSSFTTEAELTQLFAQVGNVVSMQILTDRHTGAQRGYAFLEMESLEISELAVQKIHGYVLHDRKIQVKLLGVHQPPNVTTPAKQSPPPAKQRKDRAGRKKPN